MNSKKTFPTICSALFLIVFLIGSQAQTKPIEPIISGVVNGKALSLPKPEYPDEVKKMGLSGTVNVRVVIDEYGNVISSKAESGVENSLLRKVSEEAALKAKFSPTRLSGNPVKVSGVIVYNFTDDLSNEEKLKVFGISTFLFTLQKSAADIDQFNSFLGTEDAIKDTISEFSEFTELSQLKSINKLKPENRLAKINEVILLIKSKLNSSDMWQFELGESFAGIMYPFIIVNTQKDIDLSKFDETQLKQNLSKIKELCLTTPPNFPKDVLLKLNEFSSFDKNKKIISPENFEEFFSKMQAIFEAISPGSTK